VQNEAKIFPINVSNYKYDKKKLIVSQNFYIKVNYEMKSLNYVILSHSKIKVKIIK